MESIESKLDRLSPAQRREVEDYVDFLLYRSGSLQAISNPAVSPPPILKAAPPLLPVMEPLSAQENPQTMLHNTLHEDEIHSPSNDHEEPLSPLREIAMDRDDRANRDYMDYGEFEQHSPATEGVKKVKAKIIRKNEQDTSRHLLDWID